MTLFPRARVESITGPKFFGARFFLPGLPASGTKAPAAKPSALFFTPLELERYGNF
ncbi:hypothetical protein [Hydrogenophaga atypica]|uniref:hypothetical protein n=1 Tax=Hydrogenophaga atypica TaxID=249409 RepID=UPI0036D290B4